jgi:oligopeptide transport system ATP-binding protein
MKTKKIELSVKDLTISFRTNQGLVQAVRGISFDLYKGETLAIVGESGSGKSVSSRAIVGILPGNGIIEKGSILYEDQDLTKIKEEQFHKIRGNKIGMIFQDPMSSLNPIMRIGSQITESMLINGKHMKNRYKELFHSAYTNFTNTKEFISELPSNFEIKSNAFIWYNISAEQIINFFEGIQSVENLKKAEPRKLVQFINAQQRNNELTEWRVALMSKPNSKSSKFILSGKDVRPHADSCFYSVNTELPSASLIAKEYANQYLNYTSNVSMYPKPYDAPVFARTLDLLKTGIKIWDFNPGSDAKSPLKDTILTDFFRHLKGNQKDAGKVLELIDKTINALDKGKNVQENLIRFDRKLRQDDSKKTGVPF